MPDTPENAVPVWRSAVRRGCVVVAALALGAMSWTAVHDILGGERDLTAQWTFLVFAGLLGTCSAMGWLMRATGSRR
jgi:hypothetical protein